MNPLLKKKFGAFFESTDFQLNKARSVAKQAENYAERQTQQDVFKIIFKEIFKDESAYLTWAYFVNDQQDKIDDLQTDYNHFANIKNTDVSRILQEIEGKVVTAKDVRDKGLLVLKSQLKTKVESRIGEKITRLKNSTIPNRIKALDELETKGETLLEMLGFAHDDIVALLASRESAQELFKAQNPKLSNSQLEDQTFNHLQTQIEKLGAKKQLATFNQEDLVDIASVIEIIDTCEKEKEGIAPLSGELGRFAQKRVHKITSGASSDTPRFNYYFDEFVTRYYSDYVTPEGAQERIQSIGEIMEQLKTSYTQLYNKHINHTSTEFPSNYIKKPANTSYDHFNVNPKPAIDVSNNKGGMDKKI